MSEANSLGVVKEVLPCRAAPEIICEPLRFEHLFSKLSAKFVNLSSTDRVRDEIVDGLKEIVLNTGLASGTLIEFSEGSLGGKLYQWTPEVIPQSLSEAEFFENFAWGMGQLKSGIPLDHVNIADIPEAGYRERSVFKKFGFKFTVSQPFTVGKKVVGALAFCGKGATPRDMFTHVKVLAEVFCNSISRGRSEEALQRAIAELDTLREQFGVGDNCLPCEGNSEPSYGAFVGSSDALKTVFRKIEQVASSRATVLVTGETGTGKELVARAIHDLSPRGKRPFVKLNCGALAASLIESELFGHEKGSFTGAFARKIGRFELADKSSIFLDEIGELPMDLQVKLLRVVQEGEFERVGSSETRKVDVRIIVATNRDLQALVAEKKFREDLYYRFDVFPIHCPPLRERREDIPALVGHFLDKFRKETDKRIECIPQRAMTALMEYNWPGNIRELQNVVERAVLRSTSARLNFDDWYPVQGVTRSNPVSLRGLHDAERDYIMEVLQLTGWRVSGENGAAKILQVNPKTLESMMKRLNVCRPK